MNIKDNKILKELDLDQNISTSKLAKKVRLSQQVVDYRLKKLIEDKVIKNFGTIINLSKLGYKQYRLLLQIGKASEEAKHEIINYLKNHEKVYWAVIVGGKWDLFSVVWVKDYADLETFLDELFKKFTSLKDFEAMYSLSHEFHKHKYLHENKILETINLDFSHNIKLIELDKLDILILNQMKLNSRLSSLEISKKANTSYKTVQNRVKNLEKEKVITGYRLFLKSEEYNYKPYLLLISFQSYGLDIEKKIWAYARNHQLITQATKLFGRWSLLFHVRTKDERQLQNLIIELRTSYPIIGAYEIIPVFEDILINHFPINNYFSS